MKKVFLTICSLLPGGLVLAGAMMLFVGCSRYQYQIKDKIQIQGRTADPVGVMLAVDALDRGQAESYAVRKCADEPAKCFYGWGYGSMDTPAGYTWAGIRAAGVGGTVPAENGDVRKDIADIKKSVRAVSKWQDAFTQTYKNRKEKGK